MSKVFISYNSNDRGFSRKLYETLVLFGLDVWIDEFEILPGDSLIEKIENGISDSDYLLVVLSEDSVKSEWVKRELRAMLTAEIAQGKVKVVPLVISDCEMPVFLQDKLYVDFRADYFQAVSSLLRRFIPGSVGTKLDEPYIQKWVELNTKGKQFNEFSDFVRSEEARIKKEKTREARYEVFIEEVFFGLLSLVETKEYDQELALSELLNSAQKLYTSTEFRRRHYSSQAWTPYCKECGQLHLDYTDLASAYCEGVGRGDDKVFVSEIAEKLSKIKGCSGGWLGYCWGCVMELGIGATD